MTYIKHKIKVLFRFARVHLLTDNVLFVVFQAEKAILCKHKMNSIIRQVLYKKYFAEKLQIRIAKKLNFKHKRYNISKPIGSIGKDQVTAQ